MTDMRVRVQQWGNHLALRIPKTLARETGIESNTLVDLVLVDGRIVIQLLHEPKYTLTELLAQVRDDNLHHEVDSGSAMGNEVW